MPAKPPPRVTSRAPASPNVRRPVQLAIGASGLAMLALVLGWIALSGGGEGGVDPQESEGARVALEQAGCTLNVAPAQGSEPGHLDVPTPDTRVEWNTFPPTSGPHYAKPVVWGAYEEPLEQTRVVHNLEHGGISIQYGELVPEQTVAALRDFYDDHQNGTLLAPLPELGLSIALAAWVAPAQGEAGAKPGQGYLATCTSFDEPAFAAFLDAFQFKGPERFPEIALAPGT